MSDDVAEGFDEWYSQAFEGAQVASFNALEALSIDKHVQDLARPDPPRGSTNEIARHLYNPDTVYPQVWVALGFNYSVNVRSQSPAQSGKDENLALTEALTDRCQRIVELEIQLNNQEDAQKQLDELKALHQGLKMAYDEERQLVSRQCEEMDHLRRSHQASQDNLAGLAGMIAELQASGGGAVPVAFSTIDAAGRDKDVSIRSSVQQSTPAKPARSSPNRECTLVEYDVVVENDPVEGFHGVTVVLDDKGRPIADTRTVIYCYKAGQGDTVSTMSSVWQYRQQHSKIQSGDFLVSVNGQDIDDLEDNRSDNVLDVRAKRLSDLLARAPVGPNTFRLIRALPPSPGELEEEASVQPPSGTPTSKKHIGAMSPSSSFSAFVSDVAELATGYSPSPSKKVRDRARHNGTPKAGAKGTMRGNLQQPCKTEQTNEHTAATTSSVNNEDMSLGGFRLHRIKDQKHEEEKLKLEQRLRVETQCKELAAQKLAKAELKLLDMTSRHKQLQSDMAKAKNVVKAQAIAQAQLREKLAATKTVVEETVVEF